MTSRIDGLCASAATFVALAANIVRMQDTAYFMIHDPSTIAWGTLEELKKTVDFLKEIKSGLVDAYQGKTKLDPEKLSRMMTDETWMTAKEARELGFIDEVIGERAGQAKRRQPGRESGERRRNHQCHQYIPACPGGAARTVGRSRAAG